MKKRGFGSPNYDRNRARQIQASGARALHETGKAHKWTAGPEGTAGVAGVKGRESRAQRRDAAPEREAA